jgi:hypothetical protein
LLPLQTLENVRQNENPGRTETVRPGSVVLTVEPVARLFP